MLLHKLSPLSRQFYFKDFLLYITTGDEVILTDLLKFWTGMETVPSKNLIIKFDESLELPQSRTCLNQLTLPTNFQTYESVKESMERSLKYGCEGYAFV